MTDFVAWFRAQLDADERREHSRYVIRESPRVRIQCPMCPSTDHSSQSDSPDVTFEPCRHTMSADEYVKTYGTPNPDPFVLADIAAKRKIIDLHERRMSRHASGGVGASAETLNLWVCTVCCDDTCPTWHERGEGHRDPGRIDCCDTLALLAEPYADRDGYDERWRP